MTQINLKFSPEMEELIMQGKKICTSRMELKGHIGDTFVIGNRIYRIISTELSPLEWICAHHHKHEGFEDEDTLYEKLNNIYPELEDTDCLWVHWFAYVGDAV